MLGTTGKISESILSVAEIAAKCMEFGLGVYI
jgi:hypothetical protein